MLASTLWAILLLSVGLELGVEVFPCVQVGCRVVVFAIIIVFSLSHWVLPCPASGGEWEKHSNQRIKTVSSQVQLLQRIQAGGREDQSLHGGEVECGAAACLCK